MAELRYELRSIGRVCVCQDAISLRIDEPFRSALEGLADFSHVIVVFWCHHVDTVTDRRLVTCDRPYKSGPDRLGVFATRSPARPNPIGITPVSILQLDREQGTIHIPFIDAEDGTPILDLKPYHPSLDRVRDTCVPKWCGHWPQWSEDAAAFDWAAEFSFS